MCNNQKTGVRFKVFSENVNEPELGLDPRGPVMELRNTARGVSVVLSATKLVARRILKKKKDGKHVLSAKPGVQSGFWFGEVLGE